MAFHFIVAVQGIILGLEALDVEERALLDQRRVFQSLHLACQDCLQSLALQLFDVARGDGVLLFREMAGRAGPAISVELLFGEDLKSEIELIVRCQSAPKSGFSTL